MPPPPSMQTNTSVSTTKTSSSTATATTTATEFTIAMPPPPNKNKRKRILGPAAGPQPSAAAAQAASQQKQRSSTTTTTKGKRAIGTLAFLNHTKAATSISEANANDATKTMEGKQRSGSNAPRQQQKLLIDTQSDVWRAPEGQDGSGRTKLNNKFAGRY